MSAGHENQVPLLGHLKVALVLTSPGDHLHVCKTVSNDIKHCQYMPVNEFFIAARIIGIPIYNLVTFT